MTNREVVERILDYHPDLPGDDPGCDNWKCGDPDAACTGVVTALAPNIDVIRRAAQLGASLLVVHEPTFYTSEDGPGWFEDFPNSVYEEKRALLDRYGIAVWRDHDHLHAHRPDGIFAGVIKYLGWEGRVQTDTDTGAFPHFLVDLPPETTLRELCRHLIDRIGLNGVRYIGDPDARIGSLAIVGHLFPGPGSKLRRDGKPAEYSVGIIDTLEQKADAIMPGEVIDWTVASYIRDAVQLGRVKAMIGIGHFNWEELGMRYAADWLSELVGPAVKVTYVPSGDMYGFEVK